MKCRKLFFLLLTSLLLITASSCGKKGTSDANAFHYGGNKEATVTKAPEITKETENEKETDTAFPTPAADTSIKDTATAIGSQTFSNDAGTSIDVLREEISRSTAVFGVAYIGYLFNNQSDEEVFDFDQWLYDEADLLSYYYPFITEIDTAHTIGTEGNLYCILARDYDTTITVTATDSNEVLYHSENGDPIFLFSNWNTDLHTADCVVTITPADQTSYQWLPSLDQNGYPNLLIGEERELISWDFTLVPDSYYRPESAIADGWFGPAKTDLGETIWWTSNEDDTIRFCFTFYKNANDCSDGEAILECFYENDISLQAQWQGWWRLKENPGQPSRLELDLMLMDGISKDTFEESTVISEAYAVLLSPSKEMLRIYLNEYNTLLPIFPDGNIPAELELIG